MFPFEQHDGIIGRSSALAEGWNLSKLHRIGALPLAHTDLECDETAIVAVGKAIQQPAIVVSPISGLITTEDGGIAGFTVVLASQPSAPVTIYLHTSDETEGVANPLSLVFTAGDWDRPIPVQIDGIDDQLIDGDHPYKIFIDPAQSEDPQYSGRDPEDVSVTNRDNDSVGVAITESDDSTDVAEGGPADSYAVVLTHEPTAPVTVIAIPDSQVTVLASPSNSALATTLTFDSSNWSTPQTISVTGVVDNLSEGYHTGTIRHTVASEDNHYNGIQIDNVTVKISETTTYIGNVERTQIATETLIGLYVYEYHIQGSGSISLSGSGTTEHPYAGTFEFSGTDTIAFVSGPEGDHFNGGVANVPLTFGPISANGSTITATVSSIVDLFYGTAFHGTFEGNVVGDNIIGTTTVVIPDAGVNLSIPTVLTKVRV